MGSHVGFESRTPSRDGRGTALHCVGDVPRMPGLNHTVASLVSVTTNFVGEHPIVKGFLGCESMLLRIHRKCLGPHRGADLGIEFPAESLCDEPAQGRLAGAMGSDQYESHWHTSAST